MNVDPAEKLEASPSTKRTRTAKMTVLEEEEIPTPTSGNRKRNTRSAKVTTTIEEDAGSDHIPEAEAETVSTPAPPKSRGRKVKASEDSALSRLPRATRTLRTPLTESTTTKGEEQEVEVTLVASTDKKASGTSRARGVRSTTGSSSARSKSSSAATSLSITRRAKGVDENIAPAVLEPAARVTRTRGRK